MQAAAYDGVGVWAWKFQWHSSGRAVGLVYPKGLMAL
jgi:hypothetical protein